MLGFSITEFSRKILGVNQRNLTFIRRLNPAKYKKYADDKLLTKKVLGKKKIKTPELFKIIRTKQQLEYINWAALPKSFVIKPNKGTHGSGIIVFYGKKKGKLEWIMPSMETMTVDAIKLHISDIIDGKYAIDGKQDIAFFEERISNHPVLKPYSYKGIPDIRVIVYNSFPIMAELRLPTRESRGTANLHAGGIGVGIDIGSGVTTTAIHRKGFDLIGDRYDLIEETLDEPRLPLRGIKIPHWEKILELSVISQQISKLGLVGVDIVIDETKGPMILELNARPGLAIQLANQEGLLERITQVQRYKKKKTVDKYVTISRNLFGGEIEEQVENLTGREIIGLVERAIVTPTQAVFELMNKGKKKVATIPRESVKSKVDTGALKSAIDYNLAIELGYKELIGIQQVITRRYHTLDEAHEVREIYDQKVRNKEFDTIKDFVVVKSTNGYTVRAVIEAQITLGAVTKVYRLNVSDRADLLYPVIIGKKDLKEFLIDPTRTFTMITK
ncbi:ATP-dependent zinc protease [bacterium]|nr:ATP-dependent zinc protease [bacterium]